MATEIDWLQEQRDKLASDIERLEKQVSAYRTHLDALDGSLRYLKAKDAANTPLLNPETTPKTESEKVRAIVATFSGDFTMADIAAKVDVSRPNISAILYKMHSKTGELLQITEGKGSAPAVYRRVM